MDELKIGKYRHFKGREYLVLGIGRHSETMEEFVVYKALYDSPDFGKNALWLRPKAMFLEKTVKGGKEIPRFEFVSD